MEDKQVVSRVFSVSMQVRGIEIFILYLFSVEESKYKAVNKTQNAFTFTALHVICEIRLWENFFLLAQTILLCWQFLDIFEKQHFLTVNLATGQPTCLYL